MSKDVWTAQRMLDWSKKYFEDKGLESPALDAQILLGHALNMSRVQLILDAKRPITDEELARYKVMVLKRVKERQPVAYILGHKEFWSLDLCVTPDVLIPRPDTECLVEHALAFIEAKLAGKALPGKAGKLVYEAIDPREAYYQEVEAVERERELAERLERGEVTEEAVSVVLAAETSEKAADRHTETLRIVDVGTGSGAIALALALELKSQPCEILAVDISQGAVAVAKANAEKHGLAVEVKTSDLLDACDGMFDMIVSNPPYITTDEMLALSPEVCNEPKLALEAGTDGLDVYRKLIPQAFSKLRACGGLLVEIGYQQSAEVEAIFAKAGFKDIQTYKDYGRNPRVVFGTKAN